MIPNHRLAYAFLALIYCCWASATLVRHFAGTPDLGMRFLLYSPIIACVFVLAGLLTEIAWARQHRLPWAYAPRMIPRPVRALEIAGVAFILWRSLWMWFSWDGYFYFPAACFLTLVLWRVKPSAAQWLEAEARGVDLGWGVPRVTRWTQEYLRRPAPEMRPRCPGYREEPAAR